MQVHPPAAKAGRLAGEPKTEVWYVADAAPGAVLYAGLKRGVTPAEFERKLEAGSVAGCFHQLAVRAGDALFLPSGRVHALGGGLVVFEVQQNSDTTYRVFDWNRFGLDGKPRQLHLSESLACIDFNDFEPALLPADFAEAGPARVRLLARPPPFTAEVWECPAGASLALAQGQMQILGVLERDPERRSRPDRAAPGAGRILPGPCQPAASNAPRRNRGGLFAGAGIEAGHGVNGDWRAERRSALVFFDRRKWRWRRSGFGLERG